MRVLTPEVAVQSSLGVSTQQGGGKQGGSDRLCPLFSEHPWSIRRKNQVTKIEAIFTQQGGGPGAGAGSKVSEAGCQDTPPAKRLRGQFLYVLQVLHNCSWETLLVSFSEFDLKGILGGHAHSMFWGSA